MCQADRLAQEKDEQPDSPPEVSRELAEAKQALEQLGLPVTFGSASVGGPSSAGILAAEVAPSCADTWKLRHGWLLDGDVQSYVCLH